MRNRPFNAFLGSTIGATLLVLIAFAVLQWLQIPAGRLVDWVIAIASFWWLLTIVTVPWDLYFQARGVLDNAITSRKLNIPVQQDRVVFVGRWARRALICAIALHLISAGGLYALAATNISPVGYFSSIAALLLTFLRPVYRGYEYIAGLLATTQHEFRYPREDVAKLRNDFQTLARKIQSLESMLNTGDQHSWASHQMASIRKTQDELTQVQQNLLSHQAANTKEHEQLARDTRNAVASIAVDQRFIEHVREIVRFFKQA